MSPLRCQQIAWNNPLYWENPPTTITEYRQCVIDTFKFWINVHTKPDWWVANMVLGMTNERDFTAKTMYAEREHTYIFNRDFFEFDWEVAIQEVVLDDWLKAGMWECSACGELFAPIEEDDYVNRECPHTENSQHTREEMLPSKIKDTAIRDRLISGICEYFDMTEYATEEQMLRAARQGFYSYFTGIRPRIEEHYREMRERINILTNTDGKSREDQLLDIQRATDVRHTRGEVLADYMDSIGVFMDISDVVRNQGLAAAFGQEVVMQFLEGGD